MNANKQSDSGNALGLATELHALLLAHGECNWLRGVAGVVSLLQTDDIATAASSYKSMHAGSGSFSDFYIHADDFSERRRVNEPLDQLRDQLWVALGL